MLSTELLPHVGEDRVKANTSPISPASCFSLGMRPPTTATPTSVSASTRRSALLANLMRQYYGKLVKEVRRAVLKGPTGRRVATPATC
jgi:hypothetical protein